MLQRRDPEALRSARFLTVASLRWVLRHRAYTPWHLIRYWRFLRFKLANPNVITRGMVYLDRDVELTARRGVGRLILGRWVHVGAHTALRCHEGTLSVGDRSVFGRHVTISCYLDVEIGADSLLADDVYVCDFDHRYDDLSQPIMNQGIVKARVRVEPDVWLGTKVVVSRGVVVGTGCVVGANSVVSRDLPPFAIAVGSPARVVKDRRRLPDRPQDTY